MGDPKRSNGVGQRADLASLRAQVRAIERGTDAGDRAARCPLGLEGLDHHLGGGLALGRIHEITGEARTEVRDASVFGFAAAMSVRLLGAARGGDILWCLRDANMFGGMAYGCGLAALGLDMDRVLFVEARDEAQRLWAMEEGLRCTGLAGVVGEFGPAHAGEAARVAERRLQLAAETSGVTGFLLRSVAGETAAGTADSRWSVRAAPSGGDPRPLWSLSLDRLRGGQPAAWRLFWDSRDGRFRMPEERPEVSPVWPETRSFAASGAAA
ncbi:ImuA family protein [Nisaea nitritireducens]|uniref:ImuA family protein n=1 Tax=Nisaea nitritireducens TaxID=568392 RepID=UPI0018685880|nr:hypothetical protein [Nisaea nitritireducens]